MRPPRIWVTRPQADAAGLAEALRERGFEPLIEPLLLVELTDGPPLPLDGVQALLATSANGARALARRTAERRLPLLAVGDGTARIARKLGFEAVESAGGDVASLAERICLRLDPAAGAVLHAAGTEVAGDLGGTLHAAGFGYRREVVYRVDTPERLTDALVARWAADDIDGVVVFSPRTGRTLVRLLRQSGQADASRHAVCFCLSEAVVTTVSTLRWHRIRVAAQPTQAALLDEVVAEAAHRAGATGGNCLSSKADFAVTLGATANCTRTGVGAMSSDSKQEQQPGKAAGTSEASKSTPGATPTATPDTAPAATTPPAAATPKVQATDPQPQGASPTTAGPTESGSTERGRPRTGRASWRRDGPRQCCEGGLRLTSFQNAGLEDAGLQGNDIRSSGTEGPAKTRRLGGAAVGLRADRAAGGGRRRGVVPVPGTPPAADGRGAAGDGPARGRRGAG
ncbi:MAG: uroporphyrinogen-III synthase [Defluviicoccus sp.]|nr:MAG: uroporphyrinogen-III synthase [Defluviicoccus sp.]